MRNVLFRASVCLLAACLMAMGARVSARGEGFFVGNVWVDAPVVELPVNADGATVRVDSFAPTSQNDYQMIAKAVEEARRVNAATLSFSGRLYDIGRFCPDTAQAHILLQGLRDMNIEGNGATLLCGKLKPAIAISDCQRLAIRGFTIDYDGLIASEGVVSRGGGQARITILTPGDTRNLTVKAVHDYDTETGGWKMDGNEIYYPGDVVQVSPGVYQSQAFSAFEDGAHVIVRHFVYDASAAVRAEGRKVSNLTIERITVLQYPSHAFLFMGCGQGLRVNECRVQRKEGNVISVTADGLHVASGAGNLLIENCDFGYQGDDSINIHGKWFRIARVGEMSIEVTGNISDYTPLAIGDTVAFHRAADLASLGSARVEGLFNQAGTITVRLDAPVPAGVRVDDVIGNRAATSSGFVIRDNYFHDHRARGMLLQACNGLVENNRIENVTAAGIQVTTDCDYWLEGFGCQNVLLRGNRLIGVNKTSSVNYRQDRHPAALNVVVDTPRGIGEYPLHGNIVIEQNVIEDTPGAAMLIASVQGVRLRGNTVRQAGYQPNRKLGRAIGRQFPALVNIVHARDVLLEGNALEPAPEMEPLWTDPHSACFTTAD